jgi:hypothetical protein
VRNEIWIDTDFGNGGTPAGQPNAYYEGVDSALWYYEQMIASGCSREQARAVFPNLSSPASTWEVPFATGSTS